MSNAEEAAEGHLLKTDNLTVADAAALLEYTAYRDERGDGWGAIPDDKYENWHEWHTVLMRKVADLLRGMSHV